MNKIIKDYILVLIGTSLLALSTTMFLNQHNLVIGGVVGIAILVDGLSSANFGFHIPLWLTNIVLNIPLLIMGIRLIGKKFILRTIISTIFLSIALYFTEYIPVPTDNLLLSSIYGGIFAGIGIGLVAYGGGSTGGTDLLSRIIRHYRSDITHGNILFVIDLIIVVLGFYTFGVEKGMYAIFAIYASTKIIDRIIEGFRIGRTLYIISNRCEEISEAILKEINRGTTYIKAKGGFNKKDRDMLMCVIRKRQILKVKRIISKIDKDAFVVVNDAVEVLGEGFSL